MEKSPNIFRDITYFSVGDVEIRDPRIDYITRLTLEIGSELPKGKYSLELIKPFQPLCRGGEKLNKLKSLDHKDIDSIWTFPKPDNKEWARIEIRGKMSDKTIFIKCNRIQVVPRIDENIN